MRARSGHIRFDKKVKYGRLTKVYEELFTRFLEETGQMPENDPEYVAVLLEENLRELRHNRKPEGYNRDLGMRLMFPISDAVEFYIYGQGRSTEIPRVTEVLSRLLKEHGLRHEVDWDRLVSLQETD